MKLDPPIGVPRTYTDHVGVLYPGEEAGFEPDADTTARLTAALMVGSLTDRIDMTGTWHVRPVAGLHGWWLRTTFRLRAYWR